MSVLRSVRKKIIFARKLAADTSSFIKLLWAQAYLHPRIRRKGDRLLSLRLHLKSSEGKKFTFYLRRADDLSTLKTVFLSNEYNISMQSPQYIVDLGANSGLSVIYFKLRYPEANILAVEPAPELQEQLKKNTESFSKVTIVKSVVAEKSGERTLYQNTRHPIGSSLYQREGANKKITVEALTFSQLLERANFEKVDLLKFDIEGAEFDLLKDHRIAQVGNIVGEVHFDISKKTKEDLIKCLPGFDLRLEYGESKARAILYAKKNSKKNT